MSDDSRPAEALAHAALDALDIAVLVVSPEREILLANAAARNFLAQGRGWICEGDRLRAQSHSEHAVFDRAVRRVALAESLDDAAVERATFVVRSLRGAVAALVIFRQSKAEPHVPLARFARRHRLTPAETRLVGALVAGHRVADYAAAAGISEKTARTHLKQVFAKTGLRRQADLLRHVIAEDQG